MKHKLILLIALLFAFPAFAQTDRVQELIQEGITLMDNGELDASIAKLQEARKLDPKNNLVLYEIGLAHYLKADYQKALEITAPLVKGKKAFDQAFQLRGNSYDMLGDPTKAIKTYEEGLKKFPNSGPLYLEAGVVLLKTNTPDKALTYFEKGIEMAPRHPSNYYWAAKLFLDSDEEVWGMLYGEIFRNLEPNSARSSEISKLLYDTYKSEIKFISDTTASVSFSKSNVMGFNSKTSSFNLPFGTMSYEMTMAVSVAGKKQIDLPSLHQIRTSFVENFYGNDINKRFDNLLFQWHQTLQDAGHFEAYNYWLLSAGDEETFNTWVEQHEQQFQAFADWYTQDRFPVSPQSYFHRSQLSNVTLSTEE